MSLELSWFTLLSVIANSAFLTLYFSHILSDYARTASPRNAAFSLAFLGSIIGAGFSLVIPLLPGAFPYMDMAVGLVAVVWILLLHYRYRTGWLEAAAITALAAIIYVIIMAITSAFYILWLGVS